MNVLNSTLKLNFIVKQKIEINIQSEFYKAKVRLELKLSKCIPSRIMVGRMEPGTAGSVDTCKISRSVARLIARRDIRGITYDSSKIHIL